MKILVALAAIFLVSTQLSAEEIGANDDLNYWSDWSDSDQIKEEMPEPFEHLLQRIARRPKPQQFFGLMGKRDADSSIEKQVALLKALYGKHFYKSLFYYCECTCVKKAFCGLKYRFLIMPVELKRCVCSLSPENQR
uniref:Tachykinin 1 n=1 Tax=Ovis aries TaxID=9940 RepID=A0AC11EJI7_SHEEP